jgi:hypothetical protein
MRAYYEVMRETGLRPSTLHRLKVPDDYQPGAQYLTIREDADKARYGRELPLSARARAALDSACPEQGTIFPKFDGRHTLRKAALAAGIDPERASKVSAYDLRHSLATELTERSGNLVGVGYLLGHKHITTTNHYVHARRRAAESVLSGHRLGHQRVGRPNEESSDVAQLPGIKGCGREDSCVTGMRQSRSGRSPRSCRIPGAIRRPLEGAEYTVGRVLVETYVTFTKDRVRKRGLEPPRVLPH